MDVLSGKAKDEMLMWWLTLIEVCSKRNIQNRNIFKDISYLLKIYMCVERKREKEKKRERGRIVNGNHVTA